VAAPFDLTRLDWLDLRNMVMVARVVAQAALLRTESRGAHQREDLPGMLPEWRVNQVARVKDGCIKISRMPAAPIEVAAQ
jgi:succinate dehydrogenase / fumarate reductase flavoprotein subunit